MCVWGWGSLDPADALRRATPTPASVRLLGRSAWHLEKCCRADWQEVGKDLPGLSGEGGRGIRSCPPGTGVTCPLSSGLVFSRPWSWVVLLLVSLCPCSPTPGPPTHPLPTQISGTLGRSL